MALFLTEAERELVRQGCTKLPLSRYYWALHNRADTLDLNMVPPDRLVARRGDAGLKLFHLGGGRLGTLRHAFVHDAYHPLPGQLGEGRSGSGTLVEWRSKESRGEHLGVHAIAVDDYGSIAGWHLVGDAGSPALEAPGRRACWRLGIAAAGDELTVTETVAGDGYRVAAGADGWALARA